MISTAMFNYLQSGGISQNKSHPDFLRSQFQSAVCFSNADVCISSFFFFFSFFLLQVESRVSQDASYLFFHMAMSY